jgi:hypothetical protein
MTVKCMSVSQLLAQNHYSMQANQKRFRIRDGQVTHIVEVTRNFQVQRNTVIPVNGNEE